MYLQESQVTALLQRMAGAWASRAAAGGGQRAAAARVRTSAAAGSSPASKQRARPPHTRPPSTLLFASFLPTSAELSPEGSVFVGVSVTEGVIKRIRERQASGERTSDLMSTWQFGCPPDPTEVCTHLKHWSCSAGHSTTLLQAGCCPAPSTRRFHRPAGRPFVPLQFLAACGWRLQLASTRAQQAAALGLNLEMCSFPGVSNGDASKNGDGERADSRASLFLVATPAASSS